MSERVSAVDARRSFGKLLNIVSLRHEEIIIERAGKPVAKLSACDGAASRSGKGRLDFRKCRGLGRQLWRSVDAADYLRKGREEWDRS